MRQTQKGKLQRTKAIWWTFGSARFSQSNRVSGTFSSKKKACFSPPLSESLLLGWVECNDDRIMHGLASGYATIAMKISSSAIHQEEDGGTQNTSQSD